jgi:hypothetical protein
MKLIQASHADGGQRRWAADQNTLVLRNHLDYLQTEKQVITKCISFYCKTGFFANKQLKEVDQAMLREKLFSLLSILISDTNNVWASDAVLQIEKLEEDNKRVVKLDSEIKKIRKQGLKTMKRLRTTVFNIETSLTTRE